MFAEDTVTMAGKGLFSLESARRFSPALKHRAVDAMLDSAWKINGLKFHSVSKASESCRTMPLNMNDEARALQGAIDRAIQSRSGSTYVRPSSDREFRTFVKGDGSGSARNCGTARACVHGRRHGLSIRSA